MVSQYPADKRVIQMPIQVVFHILHQNLKQSSCRVSYASHCFCLAQFAALPVEALDVKSPGPGWTEAYRTAQLVIFTRDEDAGRRIFAVSEVEAPSEIVFNVLSDFEQYPEFMPYVEESRVLSRRGETELLTYARIAPPLVSGRDYPLKVRLTRGSPANGNVFKVEWTASPDAWPEVRGVVRVRLNEGAWHVAPLEDGRRTRLTYMVFTDPRGMIPGFVINMSNTIAIPELFQAIKKRAAEAVNSRK
jgi:hypothetical protein